MNTSLVPFLLFLPRSKSYLKLLGRFPLYVFQLLHMTRAEKRTPGLRLLLYPQVDYTVYMYKLVEVKFIAHPQFILTIFYIF